MINRSRTDRIIKITLLVFVLGIAAILRLYNIDLPLVNKHALRQSFDAIYARNFYQHGFNILLPMMEGAGNKTILVIGDFPIFPYMVALIYKLTGVNETVGRLLSLFFSVASIFYMFLLVKRTVNFKTAILTAFMLAICPLHIYCGNAFMRQSMVLFLMIATIYYFIIWLDTQQKRYIPLIIGLGALAGCMNPPALLIGFPMCYLSFSSDNRKKLIFWFWLVVISFGIIFPVYEWLKYGVKYSAYNDIIKSSTTTLRNWSDPKYYLLWLDREFFIALFDFIRTVIAVPLGFLFFIWGLTVNKKRSEVVFLVWFLGTMIYYMLDPFPICINPHSYYLLQLSPVVAYYAAKSLVLIIDGHSDVKQHNLLYKFGLIPRYCFLLLILVVMFVLALDQLFYSKEMFYSPDYLKQYNAGKVVSKITDKNSWIVCDDQTHVFLYYCERKVLGLPHVLDIYGLRKYNKQGASSYTVTNVGNLLKNQVNMDTLNTNYAIKYLHENFVTYDLNTSSPAWYGSKDTASYSQCNMQVGQDVELCGYKLEPIWFQNKTLIRVSLLWKKYNATLSYSTVSNSNNTTASMIYSGETSLPFINTMCSGLSYYSTHRMGFGVIGCSTSQPFIYINETFDILSKPDNFKNNIYQVWINVENNTGDTLKIQGSEPLVSDNHNFIILSCALPVFKNNLINRINNCIDSLKDTLLDGKKQIKQRYVDKLVLETGHEIIHHGSADSKQKDLSSESLSKLWSSLTETNPVVLNGDERSMAKDKLLADGYVRNVLISNNNGYPDGLDCNIRYTFNIIPDISSTAITNPLFDGQFMDVAKELVWSGDRKVPLLQLNHWWHGSKDNSWPQGHIVDVNIDLQKTYYLDKIRLINGVLTADPYRYRMMMIATSIDGKNYKLHQVIYNPKIDGSFVNIWNYNEINSSARYVKIRMIGDNSILYLLENKMALGEVEIWGLMKNQDYAVRQLANQFNSKYDASRKESLYQSQYAKATNAFLYKEYLSANYYLSYAEAAKENDPNVEILKSKIEAKCNVLARNYYHSAVNYYSKEKYVESFNAYLKSTKYGIKDEINISEQMDSLSQKVRELNLIPYGSLIGNDKDLKAINTTYTFSFDTNPLKSQGKELTDGKLGYWETQVGWDRDTTRYLFNNSENMNAFAPQITLDLKRDFVIDKIMLSSMIYNAEVVMQRVEVSISTDGKIYYPLKKPDMLIYSGYYFPYYGWKNQDWTVNSIYQDARYIRFKVMGMPWKHLPVGEIKVSGYDLRKKAKSK